MRLIGKTQNRLHAERFVACMTVKEISAHVEENESGWEVWIRDEDRVEDAKQEFDAFLQNPDASQYLHVMEQAAAILKKQEKARQALKKNVVQMQGQWQGAGVQRRAPVTILLIGISLFVSLFTNFGEDRQSLAFRALAFTALTESQRTSLMSDPNPRSNVIRTGSIRHFELWRTVTPIFIHFGVLHLVFNGLWMFYFGRQIEARYGSVWLAILVLVFAIPSNALGALVPLEWTGKGIDATASVWVMPAGGLSGVLYGLFGYIWMKMLFDRNSGLYHPPFTIIILVGWFFFCIVAGSGGSTFRVDNWAHGAGLVLGLIVGYFPKFLADLRGQPKQKRR